MITIKSEKEIRIMAEGGKILAQIMEELKKKVKPGITTKELDRVAETLISCPLKPLAKEDKIMCSFKGYKEPGDEVDEPFPACLCVSINEELVHCLPSDRILKEGDIISLDLGIYYKGFHTDMAITLPVGKVIPEAQRLIRVTKKALKRGIKKAKVGNTFGDIGNTIQRYVESQGFNIVRDLCGHGIGKELHEDPKILNYGKRRTGSKLKEGMVFCLEPMVTAGDWKIKRTTPHQNPEQPRPFRKKSGVYGAGKFGAGQEDGFGYKTADSSLSCHFEHTIAITKRGVKVLTRLE